MPSIIRPITHTGITAELVRKSKRHLVSGFDSGADPVIIGPGAQALSGATNAVAIGAGATVDAGGDVAVGSGAFAGPQAVSIGYNSGSADQGTAVGTVAQVAADHGTALGYGAVANYSYSAALGAGAVTDRASQIMIGAGEVVEVHTDGINGSRLAMKSPNGTRYVMTVSNAGATVWTAVP